MSGWLKDSGIGSEAVSWAKAAPEIEANTRTPKMVIDLIREGCACAVASWFTQLLSSGPPPL